MKEEKFLKNKFGADSGFSVPDDYFDNLRSKILEDLPPVVRMNPVAELSKWQKIRPYLYLAAMFMGIWCMMKLFHTVSTSATSHNEETEMSYAVMSGDPESMAYMTPESYQSDYELMYDAGEYYDNIHDFKKDFKDALKNS